MNKCLLMAEAGEGDGGGDGGGAEEEVLDAKALKAEVDRLKTQNAEQEDAVRYWHEQAKQGVKPTKATPAPAAETEDEPDMIELLSKRGAKGLQEVLKKAGFVSRDEAELIVNSKATQIATENELVSDYPDMLDNKSEFFKATASNYKTLVESGVPGVMAMKLAAQQTNLDFIKAGKKMSASDKSEREERARAAGGDKSGKKGAKDDDEGDDELDAFAKHLCEEMEIPEENYKKRAKAGVRMGGKSK